MDEWETHGRLQHRAMIEYSGKEFLRSHYTGSGGSFVIRSWFCVLEEISCPLISMDTAPTLLRDLRYMFSSIDTLKCALESIILPKGYIVFKAQFLIIHNWEPKDCFIFCPFIYLSLLEEGGKLIILQQQNCFKKLFEF